MAEKLDRAVAAYEEVFEQMERARAGESDALFREAIAETLAALLIAEGDRAALELHHGHERRHAVPGEVLGLRAVAVIAGGRSVTYGDVLALAEKLGGSGR